MFYVGPGFVGRDGKFYQKIMWEPDPIYPETVEAFGKVDYNEWNW